MPGTKNSIGGRGNEQGGPNMGNDYSRDITREMQADDTATPVVKKKDHLQNDNADKNKRQPNNTQQQDPDNDE